MGRGAQDTQPVHGLSVRGRGKHVVTPAQTMMKAQKEGVELEDLLDELVRTDPKVFTRAMRELFAHDLPLATQLAARKIITIASPGIIQTAPAIIKRCERSAYYQQFIDQEHEDAQVMAQRITEAAPELIKKVEITLSQTSLPKKFSGLSSAPEENFYNEKITLAFDAMATEKINWIAQRIVREHKTDKEPMRLTIRQAVKTAYFEKHKSYIVHASAAHLQHNPVIQFTDKDRQSLASALNRADGAFIDKFSYYLYETRSLDELLSYSTEPS